MNEVEIRRAGRDDLESLIEVLVEVTAEDRYLSTELPLDRQGRRAHWEAQLADQDCAMFVAAVGGRAVGQISVAQHPEYGTLLGMFLGAAYRGCGTGRRLLDAAIEWSQLRGFQSLSLLVFAHNDAAVNLYRRCGFEQVEYYANDVRRRNGDLWDTMLMTKRLR